MTKVLQLPLAPASMSLAPMPNDMIPGTIVHIRRAKRSHDKNNKSPHAPQFLCQCAAGAQAWGALPRRGADAGRRTYSEAYDGAAQGTG